MAVCSGVRMHAVVWRCGRACVVGGSNEHTFLEIFLNLLLQNGHRLVTTTGDISKIRKMAFRKPTLRPFINTYETKGVCAGI